MLRSLPRRLAAICLGASLLAAGPLRAAELHVMSSGGLTAAFKALIPAFEARSGHKVVLVLGPSMGTAEDAIPVRLARGEPADVLLMVGYAVDALIATGRVVPNGRVDLADSRIGMAVRGGAPRPDIASLEAFKAALLAAPSIAYSDSASGVYIEREMYRRLGLQAELAPKSRMIVSERVGNVVARGDAAVGFQQMSELIPVGGIELLGPIPAEMQSVTVFSAAIATAAREPGAARDLVAFLEMSEAAEVMKKTGLEPLTSRPRSQ